MTTTKTKCRAVPQQPTALTARETIAASLPVVDLVLWQFLQQAAFKAETSAPGLLVLRGVGLLAKRLSETPGQAVYTFMRIADERAFVAVALTHNSTDGVDRTDVAAVHFVGDDADLLRAAQAFSEDILTGIRSGVELVRLGQRQA